jgi:3-oxoacyl-[acyl-carrier-protein] synthase-3
MCPERVLSNEELAAVFPTWSAEKILDKTGIRERRIAAPGETASDLAFAAAEKLFEREPGLREEIDFLIFCSQAPDYVLPTTACVLQSRMGLRTSIGAIDINLGCSGFVYGLSLAAGLIAAGAASTILLLTADTYSKYIHDGDKSVRTLFGDGAAATLIRAGRRRWRGGRALPVRNGRPRRARPDRGDRRLPHPPRRGTAVEQTDRSGNTRSADNLYMDGARVMSFTLKEVPKIYRELLDEVGRGVDEVDHVVLHQANRFMLDALQHKMAIPDAKFPRHFEDVGNTVSSTIPFVLAKLLDNGQMASGTRIILIGFGVGLSWAAAWVEC